MKDSTRRALRTGYQGLVALVAIAAIALPLLPELFPRDTTVYRVAAATAATVVVFTTGASKLINVLEASGRIPGWLKEPKDDQVLGKHAASE